MHDAAPNHSPAAGTRFRIGALLYFVDAKGRLLLLRRRRPPNRGLWCAIGGKLEMPTGESSYECAAREAREEVGVCLEASDLSLRCILSEREYQGTGHWLMFIFQVRKALERLPERMEEGEFRFFEVAQLDRIAMPELDRRILRERILAEDGSLHFLRAQGPDWEVIEEGKVGNSP